MKIEFVSYIKSKPRLCEGNLTLKIDGENKTFGYGHKGKTDYIAFWRTGGHAIWNPFTSNHESIEKAPWIEDEIFAKKLPEELYKHIDELLKVFNENVPYGCCGDCCNI